MIWLLAPHSLRKVRLCCRWLVSHHSMKGSNLIVVHRRVEITASLLNFRSLRGAQYLSDCSTALWKFPYTTQSNRSSFFLFFCSPLIYLWQSSSSPLCPPLTHYWCISSSPFSLSPWLCNLLFLHCPNTMKASLLFFWGFVCLVCLLMSSVSLKPEGSVPQR